MILYLPWDLGRLKNACFGSKFCCMYSDNFRSLASWQFFKALILSSITLPLKSFYKRTFFKTTHIVLFSKYTTPESFLLISLKMSLSCSVCKSGEKVFVILFSFQIEQNQDHRGKVLYPRWSWRSISPTIFPQNISFSMTVGNPDEGIRFNIG